MESPLQEVLRDFIPLREEEGRSKVMPLQEAVAKFIEPGLAIHIGSASIPPYATIFELIRRWRDHDPGFTLISMGLTSVHAILVHTGMLRKAVTTFLGDSYPAPGPNPVFQKAFREGRLKVEHWSLLSFVLRLKAAAMGVSFLPTRSILGSTMEKDNQENFVPLRDPFGNDGDFGLVRALAPDISIYHGVAADAQGNTIFTPPYAENVYGALASKRGVIVTVEKIVSTDFIRKHAGFVRLPGTRVLSVSEVPMAGHPGGCYTGEIPEIEGYGIDNPFILEWRKSCRKTADLEAWMKEWILDCPDRPSYLRKLGQSRVRMLQERSRPETWQTDLNDAREEIRENEPANAMERMVIAASRFINERVRRNNYRTLLAGIGVSNLAAWLATYSLRQDKYEIDVMAEVGFFGYLPRPAEPFIFNFTNIPTCKMLTDISEVLGMHVGGSRCMGSLAAAQVDRFGNINSTIVPPDTLITGSGGANDVASSASEVLVTIPQSSFRFLSRVPYITAPGRRVKALVSTLGRFEKIDGEEEFTVTAIVGDGKSSPPQVIQELQAQCGWPVKIAPDPEVIPPPTPQELALLRLFDPHRFFISE